MAKVSEILGKAHTYTDNICAKYNINSMDVRYIIWCAYMDGYNKASGDITEELREKLLK